METTKVTYRDGQKCPKCQDSDKPCLACHRVRAQGEATILHQVSDLAQTLLSLLDCKPEKQA